MQVDGGAEPRETGLRHAVATLTVAYEQAARVREVLQTALDADPVAFAAFELDRPVAVEAAPGALADLTDAAAAAVVVWANTAASLAGERPGEDLAGARLDAVLPGPCAGGLARMVAVALVTEGRATHRHHDGGGRVIDVTVLPQSAERFSLTWREVTEEVAAEARLAAAYEQTAAVRGVLQTALDATTDGFAVYRVEPDGRLVLLLVNRAAAEAAGAHPDDLLDRELGDIDVLGHAAQLRVVAGEALALQVERAVRIDEVDAAGSWRGAWDYVVAPVEADQVVLTWRTATRQALRERELRRRHDQALHAATHDPLTGLANRALLTERLVAALEDGDVDERICLVYADLDLFKEVNDTHGHDAGDLLLQEVARRLAGLVRDGDTAARLGGDEFVVLLRRLGPDWDQGTFVTRASGALAVPFALPAPDADGTGPGVVLIPSASLGAVTVSAQAATPDDLLRRADALMYAQKRARGRG